MPTNPPPLTPEEASQLLMKLRRDVGELREQFETLDRNHTHASYVTPEEMVHHVQSQLHYVNEQIGALTGEVRRLKEFR